MADIATMSEEATGSVAIAPHPMTWALLMEPYACLAARGRDRVLHRLGLSAKDAKDLGAAYCAAFITALIFLA